MRELRWRDIDRGFAEGFREYLLERAEARDGGRLARNSAAAYFARFRSCLAKAHRDGAQGA